MLVRQIEISRDLRRETHVDQLVDAREGLVVKPRAATIGETANASGDATSGNSKSGTHRHASVRRVGGSGDTGGRKGHEWGSKRRRGLAAMGTC